MVDLDTSFSMGISPKHARFISLVKNFKTTYSFCMVEDDMFTSKKGILKLILECDKKNNH